MFNDNGIDLSFVLPSGANTSPVDAASRGFGAIFENVRLDADGRQVKETVGSAADGMTKRKAEVA